MSKTKTSVDERGGCVHFLYRNLKYVVRGGRELWSGMVDYNRCL